MKNTTKVKSLFLAAIILFSSASHAAFDLYGSSDNLPGGSIQLTSGAEEQVGGAFFPKPYAVTNQFSLFAKLNLSKTNTDSIRNSINNGVAIVFSTESDIDIKSPFYSVGSNSYQIYIDTEQNAETGDTSGNIIGISHQVGGKTARLVWNNVATPFDSGKDIYIWADQKEGVVEVRYSFTPFRPDAAALKAYVPLTFVNSVDNTVNFKFQKEIHVGVRAGNGNPFLKTILKSIKFQPIYKPFFESAVMGSGIANMTTTCATATKKLTTKGVIGQCPVGLKPGEKITFTITGNVAK